MWQRTLIVFFKEVIDNARDRRSLLIALIYPLMGPLLLGLMIIAVTKVTVGNDEKKMTLHVQGIEHGAQLINWLDDKGVIAISAPEDIKRAVKKGQIELALIIPPDFTTSIAAEKTVNLTMIADSTRLTGLVSVNRARSLLSAFNNEIWGQRIAKRGVEHRSLQPISLDNINIASGTNFADVLLFMVPPLFIFNLFMGGVYLSIDTTSGERERGSLEPLLINPVKRSELVLGKFLAALLYTGIAVMVQLLALKLAFAISGGGGSSFTYSLSIDTLLAIILITFPLMMVAVAVQFIIATLTRSFKEAQTYLGLLPLVPAIPGMIMVFVPVQVHTWMMVIPTYSQTLLLGQILRGDEINLLHLSISLSTTTAIAILLLSSAVKLYKREELIFGS